MVFITTRKPVAAGTFYADRKVALIEQIRSCFKHERGPGKLPDKNKNGKRLCAAIVPHAGYAYSGACAAHVYKALAEAKKPDAVILIGPTHSGLGRISVWRGSPWETPIGDAKIDRELTKEIMDTSDIFDSELMPHMQEHSLEVQVPFLQYIYGDDLKIVPIVIAPRPSVYLCKQIGESLAQAVKDSGKKVVVLASSDFTHYGVSYGYMPFFGGDIRAQIEKLDKGAIKEVKALQLEKYMEYLDKTKATICGRTAIGVLIAYAKAMGVEKGKLLKYYLSGDLTGSYMNSVSYAGILF